MTLAFCSVISKPGLTALVRSTKSLMASKRPSSSTASRSRSGSNSEGTSQVYSPAILNVSRLVARTRSSRQERSNRSDSMAQASTRCSQLSNTRSTLRPCRCAASFSVSGWPGTSRTPSACATAWGTRSGSESGASSISHTPSSKEAATPMATARARRVLPDPPGPVSVTRW